MSSVNMYPTDHQMKPDVSADLIRQQLLQYAKNFKTSWVSLGQAMYSVWKDKLYYAWGYEKFEYYTERELGIKKTTAIKLLKTYFFLEQEEPAYLTKEFAESREPVQVPHCDTLNVLRLAKRKKELEPQDYHHLKKSIFDQGKDASVVRKDLTAIMRQRKEVDPDEERKKRSETSVRRFLNAARSFQKDMETLKLISGDVLQEIEQLTKKLELEVT